MRPTLWITGVGGFTGRHLLSFFDGRSDRPVVVGLGVAPAGPRGVDAYFRLDLCDREAVAAAARERRPRWVIHLAGVLPPTDEAAMWRVNVGGTVGLLLGLRSAGCAGVRLLSVGSASEYAPVASSEARAETSPCGGASAYGDTKWVQTLVALEGRSDEVEPVVARTFNLIGPGLSPRLVVGSLCAQFARGESLNEVVVGNVESARDYVDVRDAAEAYWLLAVQGRPGEVYNVCSGRPVTVADVLRLLERLTGRTPRVRVDPERLRPSDPPIVYGTCTKLREATGWEPRFSLQQSLRDMLGAV